ncbi:MAG TPA: DUF488 domain-containing protein [Actinomycetota bacterium]|nr:DUF488 domain-containing protein [Actinomycetota bacterium]
MEIFSIGFTKTSAEHFFTRLTAARVRRVVDVRLNTTSQLAGFAKGRDLPFFLKVVGDIDYRHEPLLCPTDDILEDYKRRKSMTWGEYERRFLELMRARSIETALHREEFRTPTALLCSEATPEQCHRRLVLEYLRERWPEVTITHL